MHACMSSRTEYACYARCACACVSMCVFVPECVLNISHWLYIGRQNSITDITYWVIYRDIYKNIR